MRAIDGARKMSASANTSLLADMRASPLLDVVDQDLLSLVAANAKALEIPRGAVLVREGGAPDALYIVAEGRIEIVLERVRGDVSIDVLGRGDVIGDMALLLNRPRSATARAVRTSRVVRIEAADFRRLLDQSPAFSRQLATTLGARLQKTTHRRAAALPIERIALVGGAVAAELAPRLTEAVSAIAGVECRVDDEPSDRSGHLVMIGNATDRGKLQRILRSADLAVVVVDARRGDSDVAEIRRALGGIESLPRVELALVRPADAEPIGTRNYLRSTDAGWHHLRRGNAADVARMARRIVGAATGIVLSGGGARGFAHIGVFRALDAAGVPIDYVAGASMGAIVGAQFAAGYGFQAMREIAVECYLGRSRLSDYALPYVALHNGAGTIRRLKRIFGERRIENLPIPYLCVSANLGTAETIVHETGKIWFATRCSCSVPGLLPPVRRRGAFLVDGGLLDNLPVGALRARCRGRIVASDVSVAADLVNAAQRPADWRRRRRWRALLPPARQPGIGAALNRAVSLASVRDSRLAGTPVDIYLQPPLDDIGMGDFDRLDEIIERGEVHARERLAELGIGR
jgi:NTE family protein